MKNRWVALVLLALTGCSAPPYDELKALLASVFEGKGRTTLRQALQRYEDGDYVVAAAELKAALERGLEPADRVTAHKHLAFIHCAAERREQCRAEFRRALTADPRARLDPAEAGHPAWGPIFSALAR